MVDKESYGVGSYRAESRDLVPGSLRVFRHFKIEQRGISFGSQSNPSEYTKEPYSLDLNSMGQSGVKWKADNNKAECLHAFSKTKFFVDRNEYEYIPLATWVDIDAPHMAIRPYYADIRNDVPDPQNMQIASAYMQAIDVVNRNVSSYNSFLQVQGKDRSLYKDFAPVSFTGRYSGFSQMASGQLRSNMESTPDKPDFRYVIDYDDWIREKNNALETHTTIPVKECTCGFYASYDPDTDFYAQESRYGSMFYNNSPYTIQCRVFGSVRVWGSVVMGTKGVRAQYAKIEALCPEMGGWEYDVVSDVARVYGVPAYRYKERMLKDFPQEDVSNLLEP